MGIEIIQFRIPSSVWHKTEWILISGCFWDKYRRQEDILQCYFCTNSRWDKMKWVSPRAPRGEWSLGKAKYCAQITDEHKYPSF